MNQRDKVISIARTELGYADVCNVGYATGKRDCGCVSGYISAGIGLSVLFGMDAVARMSDGCR